MAKVNREAIGTMPCQHCGGVRTVHETGKGTRKGYLYTRCPSCPETKNKCIQKLDSAYQAEIKSKANWREGFEQYGAPLEPIITGVEKPSTLDNSKGAGGLQTPKSDLDPQKPAPKRAGAGVFVAITGLLLIAAGVMTA